MIKLSLASAAFVGLLAAPAAAASFDLSGTWSYTVSKSWKKGPCPAGASTRGKLRITQKGKTFTLVLLTGRVCNPGTMCTFKGKVSGATYKGGNSAKVDSEGGTVKNELIFTATSKKAAAGKSTSGYRHPRMKCAWGSEISLTR